MSNPQVSNPKDHVVVTFHNNVEFGFTPEMGCMYDGRAIHGRNGLPGLEPGESKLLPYHVGQRLAINLAKRILNTSPAATVDAQGVPTGVPIWSATKLQELASTFVQEEYTEAKPIAMTETDRLMAKVAELEAFMKANLTPKEAPAVAPEVPVAPVETAPETVKEEGNVAPDSVIPVEKTENTATEPKVYLDKKEVIDELTKRGIKFNTRSTKADLEKLLA